MAETSLDRVHRLKAESDATRIEARSLADSLDESTGASWFWAFLFGPLYFAFYGFWGRAAVVLCLNLVFIGIIVAPFLAYPAWRQRATKKAEDMLTLDKLRHAA